MDSFNNISLTLLYLGYEDGSDGCSTAVGEGVHIIIISCGSLANQ